jgi:hypothetical protein
VAPSPIILIEIDTTGILTKSNSMSFFEGYQQTVFFYPSILTFPGVTEEYEVYTTNYLSTRNYTLIAIVQDIDTSIVVRLEGTLDGKNYGALISNTITENGVHAYNVVGFPVKKIRANLLKRTGGNNASVTFQMAAN